MKFEGLSIDLQDTFTDKNVVITTNFKDLFRDTDGKLVASFEELYGIFWDKRIQLMVLEKDLPTLRAYKDTIELMLAFRVDDIRPLESTKDNFLEQSYLVIGKYLGS